MKKIFSLLVLAVILIPTICLAEGLPRMAVMPFKNQAARLGVISDEDAENIRLNVEVDIVQTKKFDQALRGEDLNASLTEMMENNNLTRDMVLYDPATSSEFGKWIGAQYLVLGTITALGERSKGNYVASLSLRMIEVETARIYLAGRGKGEGKSAIDALEKAAEEALNGKRGMLTMMRGGK